MLLQLFSVSPIFGCIFVCRFQPLHQAVSLCVCVCVCVCVWYRSQSVNNGERWVPHERSTTSAASVSLFSPHPSLFLFCLSLQLFPSLTQYCCFAPPHPLRPCFLFWPASFSLFYFLCPFNLSPFSSSFFCLSHLFPASHSLSPCLAPLFLSFCPSALASFHFIVLFSPLFFSFQPPSFFYSCSPFLCLLSVILSWSLFPTLIFVLPFFAYPPFFLFPCLLLSFLRLLIYFLFINRNRQVAATWFPFLPVYCFYLED